jgi:hypothetical protein
MLNTFMILNYSDKSVAQYTRPYNISNAYTDKRVYQVQMRNGNHILVHQNFYNSNTNTLAVQLEI